MCPTTLFVAVPPAMCVLPPEMEQRLIDGSMDVADIPDAWDAAMQDVHWPSAGVGYFPTYTLGAIAAAQFKAAIRRDVAGVDAQIAQGDLSSTKTWLRKKIWSQGSLYGMQDIMIRATGKALDVSDFKQHLQQRYLS